MRRIVLFLISCVLWLAAYATGASGQPKVYRPVAKDADVDIVFANSDTVKNYHFYEGEWYETKAERLSNLYINGLLTKEEVNNKVSGLVDYSKRSTIGGHEALEGIEINIHHDSISKLDTLYLTIPIKDTAIHLVRLIDYTRNILRDTIQLLSHGDTIISRQYAGSDWRLNFDSLRSTVFRISASGRLCTWIVGEDIQVTYIAHPISLPKEDSKSKTWESIQNWFDKLFEIPYWGLLIVVVLFISIIAALIVFIVAYKKEQKKSPIITDDAIQAKLDELKQQVEDNERELAQLRGEKKNLEKELKPLQELQQKFNARVKEAEDKASREIAKAKNQAEEKIGKAEEERDAAKEKAKTIREEVEQREKEKYDKLKAEKEEIEKNLKETSGKLERTITELERTQTQLANSQSEVLRLNKAQEFYTTKLTVVEFATSYAAHIKNLLEIAKKIQVHATEILAKTEKKERILVAMAKFANSVHQINMLDFYTDIEMISDAQMVLSSRALATYDQSESNADLKNSMVLYFYDNYLMKYIDALVVLNESLLALDKFGDVTSGEVKLFIDSQQTIDTIVNQLGLVVNTVHLFDDTEDKMDLDITTYHGEFDFGTIVEIDNCWVYVKGGNKPTTKIRVKAQG